MVCKNCKKEFSAESESCPYCGCPNDLFDLHQQNSEKFRREYEQAEKTETRKTKHFSLLGRGSAQIAILVISLFLFLIAMFTIWAIRQDSGRIYAKMHTGEIKAEIQRLLDEGSYQELGAYSSDLGLLYSTDVVRKYADYRSRLQAAEDYSRLADFLLQDHAELTAEELSDLYRDTDADYQGETDPAVIEDLGKIRTAGEELLLEYYELSDEDLEKLPSLTDAGIQSILEAS